MIDSHAHLDMADFDADRAEVLVRARAAGVRALLCPMDIASARSRTVIKDLMAADPMIHAAAGLHPHEAKNWTEALADELTALAGSRTIAAVGEIGLDYHYNLSLPEVQRRVFRRQIALAGALGLPAIIHSRDAGADILAAVDAEKFDGGGILHCFTEDAAFAAAMIERGFWISFSGIITFPKADVLRETARSVPLDRLLVETDAPFLAPVPHRGAGRRNEPSYVVETARRLADLIGATYADFEARVERNFAAFLASSGPV
jgi:TatD DNase family protein